MTEASAAAIATKGFGVITAFTIATISSGLTMKTYTGNTISDQYVFNGPYVFTDYLGDLSSSLPLYDRFMTNTIDNSVNSYVKEHKTIHVTLNITKVSRHIPILEIDEDIVEL